MWPFSKKTAESLQVTSNDVKRRVPDNASGDFYVAAGECTSCLIPHGVAPALMNDSEGQWTECFYKRQPNTPKVVGIAIQAMNSSCVQALRMADRIEKDL